VSRHRCCMPQLTDTQRFAVWLIIWIPRIGYSIAAVFGVVAVTLLARERFKYRYVQLKDYVIKWAIKENEKRAAAAAKKTL